MLRMSKRKQPKPVFTNTCIYLLYFHHCDADVDVWFYEYWKFLSYTYDFQLTHCLQGHWLCSLFLARIKSLTQHLLRSVCRICTPCGFNDMFFFFNVIGYIEIATEQKNQNVSIFGKGNVLNKSKIIATLSLY